ncbi:MAG TPA: rhomboid family intramembrane serine protease [Stellaceae bacterium]|nr:rhomboid family intramembrane serine protease [Stellaceae bacterium]
MNANQAPRQPIFILPPATKGLLAANVVICALMLVLPEEVSDAIVQNFGFTPARYGAQHFLTWTALVDPVTYQFLHAGVTHLAVNMLGLVAFGAGVEQRLGRWRCLAFYILCGIAGAFTEFAYDPGSNDVMIGASAATSGLFGGILRLAVFRRGFWLLVALWFAMNAATGLTGMGAEGEPVAWVAHVGGFVAGLLLYPLFVRRAFKGK